MRYLSLLVLFNICGINAQEDIDINTKKGYAINGYDAISYFENNPVKGNKSYAFKYNNAIFLFASQNHLNSFKQNPEQYLPQYGGYCAYAVAKKGSKVSINPETYEIRDGKLYLFYNAWGTNTLELWLEDIDALLVKGDDNWEKIKNNN